VRPRTLLLTVAIFGLTAFVSDAPAAYDNDPAFLVPVGAKRGGFGPFRDNGGPPLTAAAAIDAFGPAESSSPGDTGCVLRWRALGIRAIFTTFAGGGDDCTEGLFIQARLTDERWHTRSEIHVGSSERRTRRYAKRFCRKSTCGVTGYALGLMRTDCASEKVPTVIATIRNQRVNRLLVSWRGCE
jgi:hypothetical protein